MVQFVVACEADADRRIGCLLAERAVAERLKISDDETAVRLRWLGDGGNREFIRLKDVPGDAKAARIRVHPRQFGTKDRSGESLLLEKAVRLGLKRHRSADGLLALRDVDSDPDRAAVWRTTADEIGSAAFRVVVGLPDQCLECWVLAAHAPTDSAGSKKLDRVKKDLKFDPVAESHRLRGKASEPRNAKRVLGELAGGEEQWEQWCQFSPLDTLRARGKTNGLHDFLERAAKQIGDAIDAGKTIE